MSNRPEKAKRRLQPLCASSQRTRPFFVGRCLDRGAPGSLLIAFPGTGGIRGPDRPRSPPAVALPRGPATASTLLFSCRPRAASGRRPCGQTHASPALLPPRAGHEGEAAAQAGGSLGRPGLAGGGRRRGVACAAPPGRNAVRPVRPSHFDIGSLLSAPDNLSGALRADRAGPAAFLEPAGQSRPFSKHRSGERVGPSSAHGRSALRTKRLFSRSHTASVCSRLRSGIAPGASAGHGPSRQTRAVRTS